MKCNTWGSRKAAVILNGYGKTLQTDYHGRTGSHDLPTEYRQQKAQNFPFCDLNTVLNKSDTVLVLVDHKELKSVDKDIL